MLSAIDDMKVQIIIMRIYNHFQPELRELEVQHEENKGE